MSYLARLKANQAGKQPEAQKQPKAQRPEPAQQQAELQGKSKQQSKRHISRDLIKNWKAARPWLLDNLSRLHAAGWTRKELFQAGRLAYPHGPWGVAWASTWRKPGVQVQIDKGGAIRWTWQDNVGQEITQARYPNKTQTTDTVNNL